MVYEKKKQEMNNTELCCGPNDPYELYCFSVSEVITKYFPDIHTVKLVGYSDFTAEMFQLDAKAPCWAWHSPRC